MISEKIRSLVVGETSQSLTLSSSQLLASSITDIFIVIIFVTFLVGIYLRRKNIGHNFTDYVSSLLTSLGILGTFFGIVIGLIAFNPKDIDSSISNLLWGMQTAFLTSVWGMFWSIIFKFYDSAKPEAVNDALPHESQSEKGLLEQQVALLKNISQSIQDDGSDSSLVNLIKVSRSDTNDNFKVLIKELTEINKLNAEINEGTQSIQQQLKDHKAHFEVFEERLWLSLQKFADALSKSATEQVIDALKQVIVDFNNNLTEQFGDNFKALNEAVLNLVIWQENYKQQLRDMSEQYTLGVQSIAATEQSVSHISEESSAIPKYMGELKSVLEVNQHQIDELELHLEAFKEIKEKAVAAVPEIEARIEQTISGVQQATTQLSQGLDESAKTLGTAIVKSAQEFDANVSNVNQSLQGTSDYLLTNSEELKLLLSDTVSSIRTDFVDLLDNLETNNNQLLELHTKSVSDISEGYQTVSNEVSSRLTQTTEELDQNIHTIISSLSERFKDLSDGLQMHNAQLLELHTQLVANISEGYQAASGELTSQLSKVTGELEQNIQAVTSVLAKNIEHTLAEQTHLTDQIRQQVKDSTEEVLKVTSQAVQEETTLINKALEKELNQALGDLGDALVSITEKFTKDYQKLVEEMHKVVRAYGANR